MNASTSAPRGHQSSRPRSRGRGRGHGRGQKDNKRDDIQAPRRWGKWDDSEVTYDEEYNPHLSERFRGGKNTRSQATKQNVSFTEQNSLDLTLNKDIRKYIQDQEDITATNQKEKWLDSPEIPTSTELHLGDSTVVDLLPNKIHDRFKTLRGYLKTHYQLLREDATSPLRDAVDRFRKDPDMEDDNDMSIYEKVHISGFTFTHVGVAARIKFSTRRAGRRILWSASKRLTPGSLIALAPATDNFNSRCIVGIVAARPLELLERSPPEVDIYFSRHEDIQIDPQVEHVMLEARTGYFEAYRHTLRAIQKISRESFPLSPHIVGSSADVGSPEYLVNSPLKNLTASLNNSTSSSGFSSVDLVGAWPEKPADTTLDVSQWAALRQILTKKIAIIQGPPGTGKTHVSKIALEILVQNIKNDDPPIIIAAQTNHALDQLLNHVSQFDPSYVRLGGRSTNTEVKKHALFEIRKRERIPNVPGSLFGPAKRKLEAEESKYGKLLTIYEDSLNPISSDKFFELGIISAAQKESLLDATKSLVTAKEEDQNPMLYWLHRALVPFEVDYGSDDFGFEHTEEDLEFEQLREFEVEFGVVDEEDIEMLRGTFKPIFDKTTIATPSASDLEKAEKMLDTKQDLWAVPEYLRGPTYHVMKEKAKALILAKFREQTMIYEKAAKELKIGKWEKDAIFLKRANIIGLTTTGLSKYRPLISSLRPKIILVEEAAEVLEGPVTAACMESVEHLILVGDHKQLQGHCSVQELENDPYYLNISMFERLVNLKMPFTTLLHQRRMEPEFRELVSSLYPGLMDHQDIVDRKPYPPWGTGSFRSFFFDHKGIEHKDDSLSTYNEIEAQMVAKFYRHLLRHSVAPAGVTILTFYNGQRKRILRELKRDPETNSTYNLVKTVDSYQGEENDIVVLSLVRNNFEGKIGFLGIDNRVCVALSRARRGFYLFGNASFLSVGSDLWSQVASLMANANPSRLGERLPIKCVKHERDIDVRWPEDFDAFDGGCEIVCGERRLCGHICSRKCHPMPHDDNLACLEPCTRRLDCTHTCVNRCGQTCGCDCGKNGKFDSLDARPSASRKSLAQGHTKSSSSDVNVGSNDPIGLGFHKTSMNDVKNITTGKALAKGGAKFHPIFVPPRLLTQQNEVQSEAENTITTANNDGVVGDLLLDDDFSATGGAGIVQSNTERSIGDGRTRYSQYFQPAISNNSISSNRRSFENRNVDSNGNNLMD